MILDLSRDRRIRVGKRNLVLSKEVLEYLALGGIAAAAVVSPYLLLATVPFVRNLQKQRKVPRQQLQNSFYYLRRQEYITVESKYGRISLHLTEKGKRQAQQGKLHLFIPMPQRVAWDHKWRIIMFDVAADQKLARDALRHLLRRIGFVPLQKSVWVYPYDCKEAFKFLERFFQLDAQSLRYLVATEIGDNALLRRHFRL